jgi:ABC-type branched-subunit amino acid transport system ATPase component
LQKRVELARALAAEPRLLILDEPMAGMNQEEKEYIARFILDAREERDVSILIIEHHMDVAFFRPPVKKCQRPSAPTSSRSATGSSC